MRGPSTFHSASSSILLCVLIPLLFSVAWTVAAAPGPLRPRRHDPRMEQRQGGQGGSDKGGAVHPRHRAQRGSASACLLSWRRGPRGCCCCWLVAEGACPAWVGWLVVD
jgi:hypothetical protein